MRKKIIIIIASIIIIAGLSVGGFFLIRHLTRSQDPIYTMSDAEFLTHFADWQKEDSPGLRWTFASDGSGTITTNDGIDTYGMTWSLDGNTLTIQTAWLYNLTDDFSFTTDRKKKTFTIVDTKEDKVTTFVPISLAENTEATDVTDVAE